MANEKIQQKNVNSNERVKVASIQFSVDGHCYFICHENWVTGGRSGKDSPRMMTKKCVNDSEWRNYPEIFPKCYIYK